MASLGSERSGPAGGIGCGWVWFGRFGEPGGAWWLRHGRSGLLCSGLVRLVGAGKVGALGRVG